MRKKSNIWRKKVFGVHIIEISNVKIFNTRFRSIEYDNHRKSRPDIKPVTEWAEGINTDSAFLQFDLNEYVYQVCNWGT